MKRNRLITEFVTPVGQLTRTSGSTVIASDETALPDTVNISSFKVYATESDYFTVNLPDIIPHSLNFTNKEDVIRFTRNPLQFYQNQFNMAIWCATSGCGISI